MRLRDLVVRNIASPYGLAIISYVFFLFACLIPPAVYSRYMHEPDLMFLDPATILFYTLCVIAFLAGLWLFESLFPPVPFAGGRLELRIHPAIFLLVPLTLGVAVSALSSVLLIKNNPLVVGLLMAQKGGGLRATDGSGLELQGTMNSSVLFLTGIAWWAAWRYHQSFNGRRGRLLVKFVLLLAVLAVFISSSLRVSRHYMVVLITGLAVAYLLHKLSAGQLNWKLVGRTALFLVLGGSLFFFLVTFLRGGPSGDSELGVFAGYTISSYNRMAALLSGRLHYEFAGKGIYFSNLLLFNHAFNQVIPIGSLMNVPDYFDWWASEFSSVGRAGLDTDLIFCGTFGDIFIEIGWFAPLYVFGYGVLYGIIWRWMRQGRMAGILLYPYFAYVILFWFTTNAIFEAHTAALVACAIGLGIYESVFVKKRPALLAA